MRNWVTDMTYKSLVLIALLVVVSAAVACVDRKPGSGTTLKQVPEMPVGQKPPSVSQSEALELAQEEFIRRGRDPNNYDTSVDPVGSKGEWAVSFSAKGPAVRPGDHATVYVDQVSGATRYMPGR